MPLRERDIIRIRQFLQRLESGLIEGMQVYVTYHDSNLAATPSDPTGDGTTGGWHREPTEASNWMSVKTSLKDTAGTWGTPIRVFGLQGTETAGVGLSADIPKLEQITFIGNGSDKVGWTGGTVGYGNNSYAIAVKAVGDVTNTDPYIYWDDADGQTSFKHTDDFSVAIAANHWVVCINDSGKAIPAASARILHAGLIQASTLSAITAALGSITSGTITFSLGGATELRIDSSGLYVSNNEGGVWTEVIKNDAGVVTMFADILKAGEIITEKIADEAASQSANVDGDEVSLVCTGGPVVLRTTVTFRTNKSMADSQLIAWIKLWRGGTELHKFDSGVTEIGNNSYGYHLQSVQWVDTNPGTGNKAFKITAWVDQGIETDYSICVTEQKR